MNIPFNLLLLGIFSFVILVIAFLTYTNDPKNNINRAFSVASVLLGLWLVSNQLSNTLDNYNIVLFLNKIIFASTSLFTLFLALFAYLFPEKNSVPKKPLLFLTIPAIAISILSFTPLIVRDITIKPGQSDVIFGPLNFLYAAQLLGYVVYTSIILIKKLLKAKGEEKVQIKLLFVGLLSFIFLVLITNLFIPFILHNFSFTTYGSFSVVLLLGFTSYAILKHHLLDVRVILTELATFIVSIALIVQISLSKSITQIISNSIVLLLVIYGGMLLIKSVRQEIKRRQEVEVLAKKLDKANRDLEDLDEQKDNFISMASHELNTPIAAIEGYLSMIIDEKMGGEINPKALSYLTNVYNSSKRLAALVHDLLNVSRIESNRIHIVYTKAKIEDIINQSISEVAIKAKEVGHELKFEKPKTALPETYLDEPRIVEVMINLIGNAIKYTDPPGKITIKCHADDGKIVVAVEDNGRGIPEDKADHVFEKFSQVDVMKDQVKGTGLGMFITENLVHLHNGKIWFKSKTGEDHGTTFYFSLPILKEKPVDEHEGEGAVIKLK